MKKTFLSLRILFKETTHEDSSILSYFILQESSFLSFSKKKIKEKKEEWKKENLSWIEGFESSLEEGYEKQINVKHKFFYSLIN